MGGRRDAIASARPRKPAARQRPVRACTFAPTASPSTSTPRSRGRGSALSTRALRWRCVTTTLQSELDDGVEFVHNEVPWSQRFIYLLHTAYWHDQWGEGHSGGRVNLAPTDAEWLFEWTEPRVPEGWHSVRVRDNEPSTAIVIHP